MDIAVLIGSILPEAGGPSYSVRRLWQSVLRPGISIHVHSRLPQPSQVPEAVNQWLPLPCTLSAVIGHNKVGYSPEMRRALEATLQRGSSLISQHGLWLYQGYLAKALGSTLSIPVIIHPHGMLEPWALRRSKWKKKTAGWLWEFENLKRAACIRVTAESELKSVRSFGLKNPVALIPNGVDVELFSNLPDRAAAFELLPAVKGRRVLLFLSRVHPKKGLPLLLNVWKRLRSAREEWVLAIVGPDEVGHTAELVKLARDLGLHNDVVFLGPLYGAARLAAYASAELFILPTYSENFGIAVAEALASAVPVITTTGAPWKGLRDQACGWWTDMTEAGIEDALREALSMNSRSLKIMGLRGRTWVSQEFAWDSLGNQMRETCEFVLGGGPPPLSVCLN